MNGTFKNNGYYVNLEVYGNKGTGTTIEALVDTGFNGYLQIPLTQALPLGLTLISIQSFTIANGSSMTTLLCEGRIKINGKFIDTTISLPMSGNILLGTELMRKISPTLGIDFSSNLLVFK